MAHGPKPRKYDQKTPKKMVRLALRSALSDRAADGKVMVIEGWNFDTPKTKDAVAALEALGLDGRVLVVGSHKGGTGKSFVATNLAVAFLVGIVLAYALKSKRLSV